MKRCLKPCFVNEKCLLAVVWFVLIPPHATTTITDVVRMFNVFGVPYFSGWRGRQNNPLFFLCIFLIHDCVPAQLLCRPPWELQRQRYNASSIAVAENVPTVSGGGRTPQSLHRTVQISSSPSSLMGPPICASLRFQRAI